MTSDDRLILLLSKAHHRIMSYFRKTMTASGINLTPAQSAALFLLMKDSYTMTELSQILSIDNSAITGLIDRLEKSGYARREMNPKDRRTYQISITDAGADEIQKVEPIVKEVNTKMKADFSKEEIETYKRVLNRFFSTFEI